MTFADHLAALNKDDQGALARREAPAEELIAALRLPRLGEWARLHILHELTRRGPALVDSIARAFVSDPLAPHSATLGEVLMEFFQDEPSTRPRVVRALIDAAAAIDGGGGTDDAGVFVTQLADCAILGGPLPEAALVARCLLDVAATEEDPYMLTVSAAKRLAGGRE